MANSINLVVLSGRLGKDAETRYTNGGVAVTTFSIAVSESFKKGDEWEEKTAWHDIVVWKKENLANHLTKGREVTVEGKLNKRSYEGKDGKTVYVTEVVANKIVLGGSGSAASNSDHAPRAAAAKSSAVPSSGEVGDMGITDDETVPF